MLYCYIICIGNYLIQSAKDFLDPGQLINGEYSDIIIRVNHAIDKLSYFSDLILKNADDILRVNVGMKCKDVNSEKYAELMEEKLLDHEKVLKNVKIHLERIECIKTLLDTSQVINLL